MFVSICANLWLKKLQTSVKSVISPCTGPSPMSLPLGNSGLTFAPGEWQNLPHHEDMSAPEKHPAQTRVLVLEEHPLLRHGIADYLNSQPDIIVCGEAQMFTSTKSDLVEPLTRTYA